ncbi:hypothetical protein ACJX0J_022775, partial [Zea mays]
IKILFAQMNAFYQKLHEPFAHCIGCFYIWSFAVRIPLFIFFEFSPHGWGPLSLSFHFVQDA